MEVSGYLHTPAGLLRPRNPGTHRTGGWLGCRVGLDVLKKRKIFCLNQIGTMDLSARSLVAIPITLSEVAKFVVLFIRTGCLKWPTITIIMRIIILEPLRLLTDKCEGSVYYTFCARFPSTLHSVRGFRVLYILCGKLNSTALR
jgi:hypothetical protein